MSKTVSKRQKRKSYSKNKSKNHSKKSMTKVAKRVRRKSTKKPNSKLTKKPNSKLTKKSNRKSTKKPKSNKKKSKKNKKDVIRLYGGANRCGSDHVFVPGMTVESTLPSYDSLYVEDKMALLGEKVVAKKVDHARHN